MTNRRNKQVETGMMQNRIAVIQAGGKGTRMLELTGDTIPKPMLLINGKPMLEWQIENMSQYGIREFIIITGHLGERIKQYFGSGSQLGVQIQYVEEEEPLGSAGALFFLKPLMHRIDYFFLVFGDVMFSLDWNRMTAYHEMHQGKATLLIHPNAHPFDSDLLMVDDNNRIIGIDSKLNIRNYWYENCVNAGVYILSTDILERLPEVRKTDLERDILQPLIRQGKVFGYRTAEYVKDAGTVERFLKVSGEQLRGVWDRKNLSRKQRCVFLDRDGTINKYKGFISREEEFELEDDAAGAIRRLNEAGCLAILVTNQPVVARGMCEIEDVKTIHRKMQVLLGEQGAYLDDIAFCPHHPDKGYAGENPLYKMTCNCRKPATGLIVEMAEKYNIDLSKSFMVGDSTQDIQTGINAGMKTVLLGTGQAGKDGKYDVIPDRTVKNLSEAVDFVLGVLS